MLWIGGPRVSPACYSRLFLSVISYVSSLRASVVCTMIPLEVLFFRVPSYASSDVPVEFPVCVTVGFTVGIPFFVLVGSIYQ